MAPALGQGVGYGIVLGLGAFFALGECPLLPLSPAKPLMAIGERR